VLKPIPTPPSSAVEYAQIGTAFIKVAVTRYPDDGIGIDAVQIGTRWFDAVEVLRDDFLQALTRDINTPDDGCDVAEVSPCEYAAAIAADRYHAELDARATQ
jgi:hypothetical protein